MTRRKVLNRDYAEAREWYEASIEENCSFAYFSLGSLYFYGNGVDKSYQKAEQYFLRTIELRENGFAEYKLGEIYSKGIDDEPNEIKAQEPVCDGVPGIFTIRKRKSG